MTIMRRGFQIRLLAGFIDVILGILVALLLSGTVGRWFAGRAVVMLAIGSPHTSWRGPVPMLLGIFGDFVYGLPLALLLALVSEALFGAGLGKWMLHMRVTSRDHTPAPILGRLLRWTIKCSGLWGMVGAMVLGSSLLALIALAAAVVTLTGFFLSAGPRSLALHDRLSGTSVCSAGRPTESWS